MRSTYFLRKMAKLFANSGDPDQMPHSAACDLGLHCLPITLLLVSRLQWVKGYSRVLACQVVILSVVHTITAVFYAPCNLLA